jgi:hypothetical protein
MTAAPTAGPGLEHVLHLSVQVAAAIEVGATRQGVRRVVPITGGQVTGPLLTGRVLPGGADYQLIRSATETQVEARYLIESDQGELVYVDNRGLRTASAADIARLRQDLYVDPARVYFRTSPRFETASPRLDALNTGVFVGVGERLPGAVTFDVFRVC